MESVSPELVLVDPALAERSRSRLPHPADTLARIDDLVAASRLVSLARRSVEIPVRTASPRSEPIERVPRVRRRRTAAFAGGLAAGALVVALLVGVRVDLNGGRAGADTAPVVVPPVVVEPSAPTVPSAPTAPPAPTVPQNTVPTKPAWPPARPRASRPEPQRFAWAPAAGASAYHVELFRGSSKVFEADTRQPGITIPRQWEFDGRPRSLEPGEYRWNVWPVFAGRRAARAIVQARFVAPAS